MFILACGIGHVFNIWVLWHPAYWLEGIEQSITAIISAYTALQLITLIPKFLSLKNPKVLASLNETLATEIEERKKAESVLKTIVASVSSTTGQSFLIL
ncbi:MAG: hypothetical protein HC796_00100 [Synechococcaceae cyanobacterium RL_1_2]|nr:hypothetical protein [Synechococcaceae cyanobacterium RL_1_2]